MVSCCMAGVSWSGAGRGSGVDDLADLCSSGPMGCVSGPTADGRILLLCLLQLGGESVVVREHVVTVLLGSGDDSAPHGLVRVAVPGAGAGVAPGVPVPVPLGGEAADLGDQGRHVGAGRGNERGVRGAVVGPAGVAGLTDPLAHGGDGGVLAGVDLVGVDKPRARSGRVGGGPDRAEVEGRGAGGHGVPAAGSKPSRAWWRTCAAAVDRRGGPGP